MILGAVGTGQRSACMYPYLDQFLAWRATSNEEKIGGLLLEVKAISALRSGASSRATGCGDDYVEIGFDSVSHVDRSGSAIVTAGTGVS